MAKSITRFPGNPDVVSETEQVLFKDNRRIILHNSFELPAKQPEKIHFDSAGMAIIQIDQIWKAKEPPVYALIYSLFPEEGTVGFRYLGALKMPEELVMENSAFREFFTPYDLLPE